MKSKSGFTLVELLIVVVVIVILSTIGVLAYINVQKQSDDTKREADITVLRRELEKYFDANGEYPLGCIHPTICARLTSYYTTYGRGTAPPRIEPSTTLAQLQSILPGIPNDFGNPQYPTSNPVNQGNTTINVFSSGYYYMSQGIDLWSRTDNFLSTPTNTSSIVVSCSYNRPSHSPSTGGTDSYIVGYYSESQGKWLFWQGQRKEPNYTQWNTASTAGCSLQN